MQATSCSYHPALARALAPCQVACASVPIAPEQAGRQCEMSRVPLLFSLAGDPLAFLRGSIRGNDLQSACLLLLLVQDRALQLVEEYQEGLGAEVGGEKG